MANESFDITVVGAGMVGASVALSAARAGWQVAVIEPAEPAPVTPDCAAELRVSALSIASERWLRRLGVWNAMEAQRMAPFRRLSVWEAPLGPLNALQTLRRFSETARTTFDATSLERSHLGHIVENRVTQYALWQALVHEPNVTRFCPATVAGLQQDSEGARVELDDGTTAHSRLVVAADGAGSPTRTLAGIGTSQDQYRQQAMVISVTHDPPQQDITWQMFTPEGPRAYLPLPVINGQCCGSLVWYDEPARLDGLMTLSEAELMEAITRAFPEELPRLTGAPARGRFPIARSHAHEYVRGRVVLVGDAAHTINPLAGQGVNLGFQDAASLSKLLLQARRNGQDPADAAVLSQYVNERRPRNALMMAAMDAFYLTFSNRQPPLHLARTLGLGLAGRIPAARDRVARYAMGIDEALPAPLATLLQRFSGSPKEDA